MTRFSKIIITLSALFALGAYAALFDTLESVDTLKKVAAQKQVTDRSPAGKVTEEKIEQEADLTNSADTSNESSKK